MIIYIEGESPMKPAQILAKVEEFDAQIEGLEDVVRRKRQEIQECERQVSQIKVLRSKFATPLHNELGNKVIPATQAHAVKT